MMIKIYNMIFWNDSKCDFARVKISGEDVHTHVSKGLMTQQDNARIPIHNNEQQQ